MTITKIPKLSKNCKNITGQRFGKLVAKQPTNRRKNRCVVWRCLCDCGKEFFVSSTDLCSGNTKSCGCSRGKAKITHGMSKTPIYKIWQDMIRRCENPRRYDYKNYGGRGIKVCERWYSFENFYADVGDPPEGLTLDRWPDNDGDYEPLNFRWATRHEQRLNSRPKSYGSCKQFWFYGHGPNGEMIIENNQHHVARIFELDNTNISACLHGKQQTHKGWTFLRI